MNTITVSQINKKIKLLPVNLLQEVDAYLDTLSQKINNKDWSETLTENQLLLIEKGKMDIEQGKVYSHKEAKQKIKEYIKTKLVSGNCLVCKCS